jgi:hypothetical protein
MPTIITRLFAAEEHAVAAIKALKSKFSDDAISCVTPKNSRGANVEDLLVKGGVKKSHAPAYAAAVRKGGAVVTVRADFGLAKEATKHLDANKPIVANNTEHTVKLGGWHSPSPFSDLMGWPTLERFRSALVLHDDPAPYSRLANLPVLSDLKPSATLLDQAAPYSDAAQWPTISRAKPSAKLIETKSFTVLFHHASPLSDLFFLPVISRD